MSKLHKDAPQSAEAAATAAAAPSTSTAAKRYRGVRRAVQAKGNPSSGRKVAAAASRPDGSEPFLDAALRGRDVHDVAAAGVSGSPSSLPHRDEIQASFGHHDVSDVRSHVGGAAASASRAIGASAYAVGQDVAFGEDPDLHTAAHEAAHVVQQRAGVSLKGGVGAKGDSYEQHADAVADLVVSGRSAEALLDRSPAGSSDRAVQRDDLDAGVPAGVPEPTVQDALMGVTPWTPELAAQALEEYEAKSPDERNDWFGAWSSSGQIQAMLRAVSSSDASRFSAPIDDLQMRIAPTTDQHAGTGLPSASQQRAIINALNPTAGGGAHSAPQPWDAHSGGVSLSAAKQALRDQLRADVLARLGAHLDSVQGTMQERSTARQIPMSSWQGVGQAAKRVTDAQFGGHASASALTAMLETARVNQNMDASGPNQTLFNAWDPAERTRAGAGIDPDDLADWMFDTDDDVQAVLATQHFNRYRSASADPAAEEATFAYETIDAFVALREADLRLYDQYDFAITDRESGRISMFPGVQTGADDTPGANGEPSPAERGARWEGFKTLVHEYIHTLEHPAFNAASQGRRIMMEGFCEFFTKKVLDPDIANAAGDNQLRSDVEGGVYPVDVAAIGTYSPGSYASYLQQAEIIRDNAPGMDDAMAAAFFQGHVELLGLDTAGDAMTLPSDPDKVDRPLGVTTVAELATASGLSDGDIRTANPGIADPVPARVALPGCREHTVVRASDSSGDSTTENRRPISAQNGVSEMALNQANPGVTDWDALTQGQHVLIPRH